MIIAYTGPPGPNVGRNSKESGIDVVIRGMERMKGHEPGKKTTCSGVAFMRKSSHTPEYFRTIGTPLELDTKLRKHHLKFPTDCLAVVGHTFNYKNQAESTLDEKKHVHPRVSEKKRIILVADGDFENTVDVSEYKKWQSVPNKLDALANLIESFLHPHSSFTDVVSKALSSFQGNFSTFVMSTYHPDEIIGITSGEHKFHFGSVKISDEMYRTVVASCPTTLFDYVPAEMLEKTYGRKMIHLHPHNKPKLCKLPIN